MAARPGCRHQVERPGLAAGQAGATGVVGLVQQASEVSSPTDEECKPMRPVSRVSGRPAHSIVLRLISNIFRLSYPGRRIPCGVPSLGGCVGVQSFDPKAAAPSRRPG